MGSTRSSTSREGHLEQSGAAMLTRLTSTVMPPISTATLTRMATWTATITGLTLTAMWMPMAMWNATSSSPPRDFPKTIIHYTKVFEYKVGNKDVPCDRYH